MRDDSLAQRRLQTVAMLNSTGTFQRNESYSARYWSRMVFLIRSSLHGFL